MTTSYEEVPCRKCGELMPIMWSTKEGYDREWICDDCEGMENSRMTGKERKVREILSSRYLEDEIDQVVKMLSLADEPDVGEWTEFEAHAVRALVAEAMGRINDGVAMVYQNRERLSSIEDANKLVDYILQTQHEED